MGIEEYVINLINLINLERNSEIEAIKEEIRTLSGKEREKWGRAILNLKGKLSGREFDYFLVRFFRKEKIDTEIEVGDLVLISKGDPLNSNLVGVLTEKRENSVLVALTEIPYWILESTIRIDLCSNDVTYKRQIENLKNLNPYAQKALSFLLKIEKPKQSHFINFSPFNKNLNPAQKKAVGFSLGSKDFFLIHGPFGTGKTTVLVELILQAIKGEKKVLVTAESNVAVDNLVEHLYQKARIVRIGHPSRVAKNLKETTLSFLTQSHKDFEKLESLKNVLDQIKERRDEFIRPTKTQRRGLSKGDILRLAKKGIVKRGLKLEEIKGMANWIQLNREFRKILKIVAKVEEYIAKEIIKNSDVVLATNSSAGLEILKDFLFDLVVIDESSQATIPSCLIPISKAKRFVLAGDYKQLPPTILNLKAKQLSETLFEKLILNFPKKSKFLDTQYRMNEILMEFPNKEFYWGKIKSANSVKKISLSDLGVKKIVFGNFLDQVLDPERILVFVDTIKQKDKFETQRRGSTSRENYLEAKIVDYLVRGLLKMRLKKEWIGIITPYDDQVDLIKNLLPEGIEIRSVDGFQGREKEIIIISFVRANKKKEIGFLEDLRRLNVALTRAKRKIILVGDSETLMTNKTLQNLITFIKQKNGYLVF